MYHVPRPSAHLLEPCSVSDDTVSRLIKLREHVPREIGICILFSVVLCLPEREVYPRFPSPLFNSHVFPSIDFGHFSGGKHLCEVTGPANNHHVMAIRARPRCHQGLPVPQDSTTHGLVSPPQPHLRCLQGSSILRILQLGKRRHRGTGLYFPIFYALCPYQAAL